ncbi:sterol desaturase [Leptolyngbya sp. 'hensonii']|uniref:sterol desaturase family protein n=1 Tax=Leptolyngbya sp. 'hensonii' TaxID=1922337 RepID=UPI00094F789A|nr:sterol desaturase family protein [Leptolyngbya sp. 'hensonii']OLP19363.1 sterol desaturase [Leptolyngbya sp. 'hensonii']
MVIFFAFVSLIALTLVHDRSLTRFRTKSWEDWVLDLVGLGLQGLVIPLLQITVVYRLYQSLWPTLQGIVVIPGSLAFLLSFVLVDYLYYWNHRLLHTRWLWPWHQVHHTVTQMDVLGTSRNSLGSSFLILYLWVHTLALYLLQDPRGYLVGVSLTAMLDLWRHSELNPASDSPVGGFLSPWLILPQDHTLHHDPTLSPGYYGANLKLWDRLHGTDRLSLLSSATLFPELPLIRKLFWPFP